MDPKHFFRRLHRIAKGISKQLCLPVAAILLLAGIALWQGRSVDFSISLVHGLHFSAHGPITATAPAAEHHELKSRVSSEKR